MDPRREALRGPATALFEFLEIRSFSGYVRMCSTFSGCIRICIARDPSEGSATERCVERLNPGNHIKRYTFIIVYWRGTTSASALSPS